MLCVLCNQFLTPEAQSFIYLGIIFLEGFAYAALGAIASFIAVALVFRLAVRLHKIDLT